MSENNDTTSNPALDDQNPYLKEGEALLSADYIRSLDNSDVQALEEIRGHDIIGRHLKAHSWQQERAGKVAQLKAEREAREKDELLAQSPEANELAIRTGLAEDLMKKWFHVSPFERKALADAAGIDLANITPPKLPNFDKVS